MTAAHRKHRIVVLFHEGDRHLSTSRYIVHHLATYWREDGHDVQFAFGLSATPPADLVLVHVNLSVVPDDYLALAARYPLALNTGIRDIRKSRVSENLVRPGDAWTGPVIVKSNLNYGGRPEIDLNRSWLERRFARIGRLRDSLRRGLGRPPRIDSPNAYEIYERLDAVPDYRLGDESLVVERFLPEIEGDLYFTRVYQVLGDRWSCTRMGSRSPIVKANESVLVETVEPPPEAKMWRERLGMDYGKLDYVVHDGRPVLLDANKTIGASLYAGARGGVSEAEIANRRRQLAQGLYWYFSIDSRHTSKA
jgi:hypothetical protein